MAAVIILKSVKRR